MVNPDPHSGAPIGNNKAYAAIAAGALSTIVIYVVDQFLKSPLPPEICAAVQTLLSTAAVYLTPHGGST
ncbi:MAG TPA: hypothetical protein VEU47_19165 [Candidatus Cybelea sp.]|nr:hypothetical protein [Candidatus Cybelea sp.]